MTNSEMYTGVLEALEYLDPFDALSRIHLERLRDKLEADIRSETAKASGKGTIAKAAERIIKSIPDTRPQYCGAWMRNGRQIIVDGYRLVAFNEPLPLTEAPEDKPGCERLDPFKLLDQARTAPNCYSEFPSLDELKAEKKIRRAKVKTGALDKNTAGVWYPLENTDAPALDIDFMIDMLECLPGAEIFWTNWQSPVYFRAENGEGIVLPIRLRPELKEKQLQEAAAKKAEAA